MEKDENKKSIFWRGINQSDYSRDYNFINSMGGRDRPMETFYSLERRGFI